ncbi:Type 1 glutamine amidotransferase-like domain-containing protein [Kushneria marisflavi]|uniref:Peptidase S51 n=1 Tax=Kushneria marisflavi TaxID=157779 RepID=A0A240UTI5_9GAMM|nr:Type 1 glutamine amidotransferase-like domain-containing protein [Kushneria marisflavi]ART64339.1 peptidase S51 [Kushneria marisflavi]RKD76807.1 dipeptidase E [Kushneria marisflavi]
MKLFLASSFAEVSELFVTFDHSECVAKTVTFIATASIPEKMTFYVDAGRKALESLGLLIDELDISTAGEDEIALKLARNEYVYVSGGNTFYLLQELKRTGADRLIIEQIKSGKTYIGESAGAVVLAADIEYIGALDDSRAAPDLGSYASLGVIEFYPLPHHTNFPFKKAVEQAQHEFSEHLDLRPFSNAEAIVMEDGCDKLLKK